MEQRLLHTPEGVRDIYSGEYARKKSNFCRNCTES